MFIYFSYFLCLYVNSFSTSILYFLSSLSVIFPSFHPSSWILSSIYRPSSLRSLAGSPFILKCNHLIFSPLITTYYIHIIYQQNVYNTCDNYLKTKLPLYHYNFQYLHSFHTNVKTTSTTTISLTSTYLEHCFHHSIKTTTKISTGYHILHLHQS